MVAGIAAPSVSRAGTARRAAPRRSLRFPVAGMGPDAIDNGPWVWRALRSGLPISLHEESGAGRQQIDNLVTKSAIVGEAIEDFLDCYCRLTDQV